ncbi:hypothetical protein IAQ61_011127 [Plenodomus lingam]|uniref:uncharacterized protein n=1 Tax=Leptosphaeria maculans TaxID=5022 RepID=UPI003318BE20|nr:hypothetical protein IAQ61_011127 [Plenodomus lingam]
MWGLSIVDSISPSDMFFLVSRAGPPFKSGKQLIHIPVEVPEINRLRTADDREQDQNIEDLVMGKEQMSHSIDLAFSMLLT